MQKIRGLLWILVALGCVACSHPFASSNNHFPSNESSHRVAIAQASALPAGQKILQTGRHMAVVKKEIIRGSCWDYINTVYNRSGYPQAQRHYVLKGKKKTGPYATVQQIQPGDWLYYINHSYHGIEHSGIFVRWVNKKKRIGLILSYGGESRKKPGRYRNYDLSHVYTIIRAK